MSENSPAPGEGRYVLFLGRVDVYRAGLDLLLAAVDLAPPPLPVILAGTGRRAERRKLVRLLGRTSGPVAWVGDVAAPARGILLRECAFLVDPARSGGAGRSVLEAMARGKPVIRFDLPGARWPGDEAAIRVPAADVSALAVAITTLSTDDASRRGWGTPLPGTRPPGPGSTSVWPADPGEAGGPSCRRPGIRRSGGRP